MTIEKRDHLAREVERFDRANERDDVREGKKLERAWSAEDRAMGRFCLCVWTVDCMLSLWLQPTAYGPQLNFESHRGD